MNIIRDDLARSILESFSKNCGLPLESLNNYFNRKPVNLGVFHVVRNNLPAPLRSAQAFEQAIDFPNLSIAEAVSSPPLRGNGRLYLVGNWTSHSAMAGSVAEISAEEIESALSLVMSEAFVFPRDCSWILRLTLSNGISLAGSKAFIDAIKESLGRDSRT